MVVGCCCLQVTFLLSVGCCVLGLAQCWGWVSKVLVCHGCWVSGTICLFLFVDARQWADEFSLVCCGCLVLFENCIVDASIFFFVIFV